ncbi:MAG: hypothetical protein ACRCXN_12965 [Bacteroidales bacterium]
MEFYKNSMLCLNGKYSHLLVKTEGNKIVSVHKKLYEQPVENVAQEESQKRFWQRTLFGKEANKEHTFNISRFEKITRLQYDIFLSELLTTPTNEN